MAATLTQERFTSDDWVFERKLDGIRLLAYKNGPQVQLYSRNRLSKNSAFPNVVEAISRLPVDQLILDGEAVGVWSTAGRISFHIFDVMWYRHDVTALPLEERTALLDQLQLVPPLGRVSPLTEEKPWERACREGWEGVIAKRRGSRYEHRRSPHWLKMKCEATQELVIGGFTDPQRSRQGLGALLVGYYEDGEFVYAGKIGTGFDTKLLLDLRTRLDAAEIPNPPFTRAVGLPRVRAHWVRPEIVVQVAFTEWTVNGKLRHSRLLGIRDDKEPSEVTRESA